MGFRLGGWEDTVGFEGDERDGMDGLGGCQGVWGRELGG